MAAPIDPTLAAALAAMRKEMVDSMNKTISDLNKTHGAELQAMRDDAIAAAVRQASLGAGAGASRTRGARPPALAIYSGIGSLDSFFSAVTQQSEFLEITADADKIRLAAVHLGGTALGLWQAIEKADRPASWDAFTTLLQARFQPITSKETARSNLLTISQGRSPIGAYVAEFSRLKQIVTDMDEATLQHLFMRGLNESTRNTIRSQPMQPALKEAMVMAVRIGTPMQSANASSSSSSTAMDLSMMESDETEEQGAEQRIVTAVLAAMDVRAAYGRGNGSGARGSGDDRQRRDPPRIKGLSPKEVSSFMDANRCFGCAEIGHSSRNCPTKKVVDGKTVWGPRKPFN